MERNPTLDFIRGLAVLGILLLNINAFGLPKAAYLNPAWYGQITLRDAWTWAVMDAVAQIKFLTLFALLFGAGLHMMIDREPRWVQSRLTILALLGLAHGLLFWEGDILLGYSIVGLLCWHWIRTRIDAHSLIFTGIFLYVVGVAVLLLLGLLSGPGSSTFWNPDPSAVQYEQFWRLQGGYEGLINRSELIGSSLLALFAQYGWQLAGMMFIGAGLMKSGWLKGTYTPRHYRIVGLLLVAIGLLINIPAIIAQWLLNWDYRWCRLLLQVPREISGPFQALGYAALLMGFWHQLKGLLLVKWIGCVGRMALSNYLLQTLLCTTLFSYFGLFLKYDRLTLLSMVPGIWAFNLLLSVSWLHYFKQGPMEYLWRKCTLALSVKH